MWSVSPTVTSDLVRKTLADHWGMRVSPDLGDTGRKGAGEGLLKSRAFAENCICSNKWPRGLHSQGKARWDQGGRNIPPEMPTDLPSAGKSLPAEKSWRWPGGAAAEGPALERHRGTRRDRKRTGAGEKLPGACERPKRGGDCSENLPWPEKNKRRYQAPTHELLLPTSLLLCVPNHGSQRQPPARRTHCFVR